MAEFPDVHGSPTFAETLVAALERYPERTCFVFEGRRQTYAEVLESISRLVQRFGELELKRGDGLAQLSRNRPEAACVQLACWAFGLRYIPLHPEGSASDHRFILSDAGADAFVFDSEDFSAAAQHLLAAGPRPRHAFSHIDLQAACSTFSSKEVRCFTEPSDVAMIIYTGGTTGVPKGVTLTSEAMLLNVLLTLSGWDWPHDIRFLCTTPITHATGCMMVPILVRGGTMVLQPKFDAERYLDAIEEHRITCTFAVPTMIYRMLDVQRQRPRDTRSLETVIYGAAPISPARLQEAIDAFGPVFSQIYSQAEAPCCATVLRKSEHQGNRLSSCGRPIAGIAVEVLDERLQRMPSGAVGEVCFRGPSIMSGYWKRPTETAETFRGGWLHTGDLAYRDEEGFIHIVDRRREMIITGGINVYPREVENVISAHPAVGQVAVIGVPDERWGEAVKALVVLRSGMKASAEELIALVRERKGPVAAPKSVEFRDSLALTALGKLDKKAMRAPYWSGRGRQV